MKKTILLIVLIFILFSCSNDENNFTTINGRVEREINGEGIPRQKVMIVINQVHGTGSWRYTTIVDSKQVTTDSNGKFSASMKIEPDTYVTVGTSQDDNYTNSQLSSLITNEDLLLKINKFLKFKIFIKNSNPFNSNDYINIDFASGLEQSFVTKIENFGIQNIKRSAENLPGGGYIPAFEETAWRGIDVYSIVHYNVPENAEVYKILWQKEKNSKEETGLTSEILRKENQINEFEFNY